MNGKAIATALEDALGKNFYKKLTDYSIASSSRYYGKIFIKVLELPGEGIWYSPDGKIPKKRVRAIHFRPYKIESNDIVTLKKAMKDFTELVANHFAQSGHSCTVATGIVDKDHPRFEF